MTLAIFKGETTPSLLVLSSLLTTITVILGAKTLGMMPKYVRGS